MKIDRSKSIKHDQNTWKQLVFLAVICSAFASSASYATYKLLGLNSPPRNEHTFREKPYTSSHFEALGSSLMAQGVDWNRTARILGAEVTTRSCGAGSPAELEFLSQAVPGQNNTLIFISIFEMAEGMLSESRPIEVPFLVTLQDIAETRPNWDLAKTLLWSYPLKAIKVPFPTTGRSWEIMVQIRDRLQSLRIGTAQKSDDAPIALNAGTNFHTENLSDWDHGRFLRNLEQLRNRGATDHGDFSGPKFAALKRILEKSRLQHSSFVVVMPVSPAYNAAFVDETISAKFESMLRSLESANPSAVVVRLDRMAALQSDRLFWDLVHLNYEGQKLATTELIEELKSAAQKP